MEDFRKQQADVLAKLRDTNIDEKLFRQIDDLIEGILVELDGAEDYITLLQQREA